MKFDVEYGRAKRFDEGKVYHSQEYIAFLKRRTQLEETAKSIYGVGVGLLLEEYADLLGDLTELECHHYFEEGYLAAERAKR